MPKNRPRDKKRQRKPTTLALLATAKQLYCPEFVFRVLLLALAGQTSRGEDGPYLAYRVALVVWIIFGLGYLLMLLGLISRALRGKQVARLEHALAQQIRGAEKRVARDLRYMRRVLNELYLQKLKVRSWHNVYLYTPSVLFHES